MFDVDVHRQAKARLCLLGFQDPDFTDPQDILTSSAQGFGTDLTVRGFDHVDVGVRRHQDGILVRKPGAPHFHLVSRKCDSYSQAQPVRKVSMSWSVLCCCQSSSDV